GHRGCGKGKKFGYGLPWCTKIKRRIERFSVGFLFLWCGRLLKFNLHSTRWIFCFFVKDISQDAGAFLISLLHDMGVDIAGGAHLRMAQPGRDTDAVHSFIEQQAGHRMPEGMGIDMRQTMPLAEPVQPSVDRIRVHGRTVLLRKEKILIPVVVSQAFDLHLLALLILSEQLHLQKSDAERHLHGVLATLSRCKATSQGNSSIMVTRTIYVRLIIIHGGKNGKLQRNSLPIVTEPEPAANP